MRSARRALTAVAALGLCLSVTSAVGSSALADTAPPAGTPATVSADPLPTVQQNGVVWSQVTVGNIVYATGSFTETWPAGQTASTSNETARTNLLAYDITTGDLVTSFDHSLNAQGLGIAASPDGKTVYVVGDFTTVDGATHNHIAAFDTSTGALLTGFTASLSGQAAAVTATSSAVYVGGNFFSAGGRTRTRLAAFSPVTGSLLSWAPTADDGQVAALAVLPDGSRVIVGGQFSTLDGTAESGMGSLDATSGAVEPWAINTVVKDGNADTRCGIDTLAVDGNAVYGGGVVAAGKCGNFEGTFAADPSTGNVLWINDCHGDTYSVDPLGSVLYVASHSHDCSTIGSFPNGSPPGYNQRASAYTTYATGTDSVADPRGWNYVGQPDGSLLTWFPTLSPGTSQHQAAWSVTGNADYVAYGGEFPSVNGTAQHGLVRFAAPSIAPDKVGPIATTSATTLAPTPSSTAYGKVNLSWTATWDRDNAELTYTILRDGTAVGTVTQASSFWQLPMLTYTDTGLTPGTSHTYRIRVTDPDGNSIGSATSAAVTVSSAGGPPADTGPTARFTSSCAQLTCALDATGSSDEDGTVTSYFWDFGDGTTGTGATTTHTYSGGGRHTVTLTVTDDGGNSDTLSQSVSTDAPPVAAFTSTCSGLTCSFDGTSSTDSDGTIASYAWTYDDNDKIGTGSSPTHTFSTAGKHTVSLTVTDNGGATSSPVSHTVATTAPAADVWASDAFHRVDRSSWGRARVGGKWSDSGCRSLSVASDRGNLTDARSEACATWLPSVREASTDTSVTMRAPSVPKGGLQVAVVGRRISAGDDVRVKLDYRRDGNVVATLMRRVGSKATAISEAATVKPAAGTDGQIHVELRVFGTSPTRVRAKVWQAGDPVPDTWTVSGSTTTKPLQHKGSVGMGVYLYRPNNPKTAALRVTSFVSTAVLS